MHSELTEPCRFLVLSEKNSDGIVTPALSDDEMPFAEAARRKAVADAERKQNAKWDAHIEHARKYMQASGRKV
jgi:hypothetical protein